MSWLLDTNVLIGSMQIGSSRHQPSTGAIATLLSRNENLCVFPQNLIEFWAVATRPTEANGLGLSTDAARKELDRIKLLFILKNEEQAIYGEWEELVAKYGVNGKAAHDARIVAAMRTNLIENLLTFNAGDFKRYSEIILVSTPQDILSKSDDT